MNGLYSIFPISYHFPPPVTEFVSKLMYFGTFLDDIGYTIPKGWKVLVWTRNVHMDPNNYPNPKEFNPSRWDVSCSSASHSLKRRYLHFK